MTSIFLFIIIYSKYFLSNFFIHDFVVSVVVPLLVAVMGQVQMYEPQKAAHLKNINLNSFEVQIVQNVHILRALRLP